MVKIKIISNPYQKNIQFEKFDEKENFWKPISYLDNENSKLISDKTSQSFLTFTIKEVLDTIIEEYDDGESISIDFEGTEDEFLEIKYLIEEDRYTSVMLSKGGRYLENARKILPTVTEIFGKTMNILPVNMVGDKDITKFKESSSNTVPLIVLGNYSSGKSTFINALIGNEVLPNSDSPLTANVFEIRKSENSGIAKITFSLNNEKVEIKIDENHYEVTVGQSHFPELIEAIQKKYSKLGLPNQTKILHLILEVINQFNVEDEEFDLSDLILLEVPFSKGILSESKYDYVIFDTPGSNSSSNKNHFEILKKALRNMSNGLTIFVSEFDQLDAVDSENLYDELNSIKEIDHRFSLIVVNKADSASLLDMDVQQVLQQSIPRNLYSEGIFFVSSIMGLGSKTEGEFFNNNYDRIYKKSLDEFENSSSEYYQRLYQHNIVPTQLKERNVRDSKNSNYPLVYSNSGLLSVESEIETFASKYSAYNKCQQTNLYLKKIIDKTKSVLIDLNESTLNELERLEEELENNKRSLINNVRLSREENDSILANDYFQLLKKGKEIDLNRVNLGVLNSLCEQYYEKAKHDYQLEKYKELHESKNKKLWDNVVNNLQGLPKDLTLSNVQTSWDQFQLDMKDQNKGSLDYKSQKNKAFSRVSQELITYAKDSFHEEIQSKKYEIFKSSVNFWEENSSVLKELLSEVVGAAEGLPLEKREDLQQLIFNYDLIKLSGDESKIFNQENFKELSIQIGDFHLLGDKNKINLKKLSSKYELSFQNEINNLANQIKDVHQENFSIWTNNLISIIESNIVDFSPNLQKTNKQIIEMNQQIEDYEIKLSQLKTYAQEVVSLLDWKENI